MVITRPKPSVLSTGGINFWCFSTLFSPSSVISGVSYEIKAARVTDVYVDTRLSSPCL